MSELVITGLEATVDGKSILRGVDLTVKGGEVHAVMGPNGSGKSTLSHVVMGRPGYEVTGGSVTMDGQDVLAMAPWQRAQAGLFLAMQYPTEVPGVSLVALFEAAVTAAGGDPADVRERMVVEAERIGFDERFLERPLNVDLSGGEQKRNETLQLGVLLPKIAILDELDSGLDIDALRTCSRRIEEATHENGLGRAGHHPLQPPLQRAAAGPGPHPGRGSHRGRGRRRAGHRAGGRGLCPLRGRGGHRRRAVSPGSLRRSVRRPAGLSARTRSGAGPVRR